MYCTMRYFLRILSYTIGAQRPYNPARCDDIIKKSLRRKMKNLKNFSNEIKKDLKETNKKSTETITIRVTSAEKKRIKKLATACRISQTQLVKTLINGADLKAIPPAEIYEIIKELSTIREIILEYCLSGDSVRDEVLAIQRMMNTFFEHCKLFYDEGNFGAAFQKYCGDIDESEAD